MSTRKAPHMITEHEWGAVRNSETVKRPLSGASWYSVNLNDLNRMCQNF